MVLNERFALFYPASAFFLDGSSCSIPRTRHLHPEHRGASRRLKLTGKLASTNLAAMVVADDSLYSVGGGRTPVFGVFRARRDLPGSGTLGAVFTSREDGPDHSRLGGLDLRLYHSKLYYVELQAAASWTERAGTGTRGPLFQATWDRTGRGWGFHYTLQAIGPDFRAASGFVNRTGIVNASAFNRFSFYGKAGAMVQTFGSFVGVTGCGTTRPGRGPDRRQRVPPTSATCGRVGG